MADPTPRSSLDVPCRPTGLTRRALLAGAAAFAVGRSGAWSLAEDVPAAKAPPLKIPDSHKISGFALGCQAWTFNRFSVLEAIEKTALAGARVIEFYPGQKLRKDQPAVAFNHGSPKAVIEQVQAKLKEHDILAVNYGVVGLPPKEDEIRKVFEFAKLMGIPAITSEPPVESLDLIEKCVKEFDIRLCIHDHPKRATDPAYKFWDPNWVMAQVKNRDPRMGACADTGHWVRSGVKPVEALKILEGRVFSSHLKDLNEFGTTKAHDVPWGTGVSGVKAILDELKRQNFDGNISIEYEYKQEDNLPEVTQCVEFVKNYK
jgi:sugar phosphate isomerase/epimerase